MRARRFVRVVAAVLGGVALLSTPARAGGGWSTPGRSAYVPAQVAVVRGTFWEGSTGETFADRSFVAYLLPANRWIQGHRVPEAAIPVAPVEITRAAGDTYVADVAFRVPDVPAGLYHIQYCTDPCRGDTVVGLGDLIGSGTFAIGATVEEGRLLMLAQRLRTRIDEITYRLRRKATSQVRSVERELTAARGLHAIAARRVRELTGSLRATRKALEAERSAVATATVIASGLAFVTIAVLVVLLVSSRRLRAARLDAELAVMTRVPSSVDSTT